MPDDPVRSAPAENPFSAALHRHRLLAVVAVFVAILAAVLSTYAVGGGGGGLERRDASAFESSSRLLVRTPRDDPFAAVTGALPEELDEGYQPGELADIYTLLFESDQVRQAIEDRVGPLPANTSVTARRVLAPPGVEADDLEVALPVIDVTAKAPTAHAATALAGDATDAFLSFVADRQAAAQIPPERAVLIEVLNEAGGATDLTPSPVPTMALVGVAVLLAFAALGYMFDGRQVSVPHAVRSEQSERIVTPAPLVTALSTPYP